MKLNEIQFSRRGIRWILNLFPPLLFNRIFIQSINDDFTEIIVCVRHSWMNKNFQRTIFGGTIFSAIDPYFPTMYWHIISRRKLRVEVWLKSAEINYKNPAKTDLTLNFNLYEEDIQLALKGLKKEGKFQVWHSVEAVDKDGIVCAEGRLLIYLRNYKKT